MNWIQLMNQVNQAIFSNSDTPHKPGYDPDNMVGNIDGAFNRFARKGAGLDEQGLHSLLGKVQQQIWKAPSTPHEPGNDPGNLLAEITAMFNKYANSNGMGQPGADPSGGQVELGRRRGTVRPASEDSYGDPADFGPGAFGDDVRPASEDPYGDPDDESPRFGGDVAPASEDPFGDPADSGDRRNRRIRPASEDPYGDPADERF